MSKIASYLGGHLRGEVMTGAHLRDVFSRDGSILKIMPLLVVYPFHTSDVRKTAHFAWQLAEKGHILPLTTRGSGSSRVGAAIGPGAIISLPTHMKSILELDTKQKLVRLQPGVSLETLAQTSRTHGLIWPVSSSFPGATVGGAIANNLFGDSGGKYGPASVWLDSLEIVTASGDCLQIGPISKRELNKKKGLSGVEGEIYRQMDGLIDDNAEIIERLSHQPGSAGYALSQVKDKKGGLNLIPLIAGSQGTLGIVTEAILRLTTHHPQREVVATTLNSLDELEPILGALNKLVPSRLEFIDGASLTYAEESHGVTFKELAPDETTAGAAGLLVIEFNDFGRKAKSKAKKAAKLLDKAGHYITKSDGNFEASDEIWQIYHRILRVLTFSEHDNKVALPLIEDTVIPLHETVTYLKEVQALAKQQRLTIVLWGHLGSGVIHARPLLNLRNLSDRQKIDKLADSYYKLTTRLGGGVAGEYGEGRVRSAQAFAQFDSKEQELFRAVKKIFDSHGIFNPGVKASNSSVKASSLLDENYNLARNTEQLPRL